MKRKTCLKCGVTHDNHHWQFFYMYDLRDFYSVLGLQVLCQKCGDKANSFVNYFGKKKDEDIKAVHDYLITGVVPTRIYQAMMNGGYYTV